MHLTGTNGKTSTSRMIETLLRALDLRVGAIVRRFNLRHLSARRGGFFRRLAVYGQVGRTDLGLPWEQVHDSEVLRRAVGV